MHSATGRRAPRGDFARATRAAVNDVREARPGLSPWRYFAKIEKPGTQKFYTTQNVYCLSYQIGC